jgi:hypothetical protein
MSASIANSLYNTSGIVTTFVKDVTNMHADTLQGYCESIEVEGTDHGFRMCPNDPRSVADRKKVCKHTLATHFVSGVMVVNRPFEHRCSQTHRVCLIVPGYTGEGNIKSPGSIGAHTSATGDMLNHDMSSYTLLVTPFNFSAAQYMMIKRSLVSQTTKHLQSAYLIKNPSSHDHIDLETMDTKSTEVFGFAEDAASFLLLSDLDSYINAKCTSKIGDTITQDDVVECIVEGTDTLIDTVMQSDTTCCKKDETPFPEFTNTGGSSTRCIPKTELFPPNAETRMIVTQKDVNVR